jgi:hypothetical protein
MIQQLICALLLCAAQTNFCMDRWELPAPWKLPTPIAAPNDGQVWTRINGQADVGPFANKIVAVKSDFSQKIAAGELYTILGAPDTFYGEIQTHHYDAIPDDYTLIVFNEFNKSPVEILLNNHAVLFCYNYQTLFRLLTVAEMQHLLHPERSLNLKSNRKSYCTLENLTPIEQRRYVRDHSCILTLLGIRAKRASPLSVIPKEVLRAHLIKPLMALETEERSKKPLQLWPSEKKGCIIQ